MRADGGEDFARATARDGFGGDDFGIAVTGFELFRDGVGFDGSGGGGFIVAMRSSSLSTSAACRRALIGKINCFGSLRVWSRMTSACIQEM